MYKLAQEARTLQRCAALRVAQEHALRVTHTDESMCETQTPKRSAGRWHARGRNARRLAKPPKEGRNHVCHHTQQTKGTHGCHKATTPNGSAKRWHQRGLLHAVVSEETAGAGQSA